MTRRRSPGSLATAWMVHLVLLGVIGLPLGISGVVLISRGLQGHGDPFVAFGSLLFGAVLLAGVAIYAVVSTVAVGGFTVVRGVQLGLSTPPAQPAQQPAPAPPKPSARRRSTALSVGGWHVVVIVAIVIAVPVLRRALHARAERLHRQANEKVVGQLNGCFEVTSWHLDWHYGTSSATVTAEGHASVPGELRLYASPYATVKSPPVQAGADSDVTLEAELLHAPSDAEPADFAFQVACPQGDIYYSTTATKYESLTNTPQPRLVRPLFPEP